MTEGLTVGDEMLEEWDWESARPAGRAVSRKKAHREGIAHEGVHLWIVRNSKGSPEILFQNRAADKELYPGVLDITVGGHVLFGQQGGKIQKEANEEIGINPSDEELVDLGYFRYEEKNETLFHREFQRVYLLADERELAGYRFNDGEVDGIFAVPLRELELLMRTDRSFEIEGFDGARSTKRSVRRADFHPLLFAPSMERYMEVVLLAVHELLERGRVSSRMPPPV